GHWPLARLPMWRVSPPREHGIAPRAPGRRIAGPGPRRPDRRHPQNARGAGYVRFSWLAADWILRPPAWNRRNLHLNRQPLFVFRRISSPGPRSCRFVLVGRSPAMDVGKGMERPVVSD